MKKLKPQSDRDAAVEMWLIGVLRIGDLDNPPAVGSENAVDRKLLMARANRFIASRNGWEEDKAPWPLLKDEQWRNIYRLSRKGVCPCSNGLFLASSRADIDAVNDYLHQKIAGLARRIARVQNAYPEFGPYRDQLVLPLEDVEPQ